MELPHHCSACGEIHGGSSADTEAVRIAKINADRDIEVARLARSEARQQIETELEETKIEAAADVETAVAEAVVTTTMLGAGIPAEAEAGPESAPADAPVIVSEPAPEADEVIAPPETGTGKPHNSTSGFWDGYATS